MNKPTDLQLLIEEYKIKYEALTESMHKSYGVIPMEEYHTLYMDWCDAKTMYAYYSQKEARKE
jgi:hypothetical protein